jgi:hypothetical protein
VTIKNGKIVAKQKYAYNIATQATKVGEKKKIEEP